MNVLSSFSLRFRKGALALAFIPLLNSEALPPPATTNSVITPNAPIKLSLHEAEAYALAHHPMIAAAAVRAAASLQGISIAQSDLLPQINGNAVLAKAQNNLSQLGAPPAGITDSGIRTRQSDGLYFSQLIFDFGRTPLLVSTARLESKSAKERLEAARDLILLNVNRTYFAALGAEALLKIASKEVETHQLLDEQIKTLADSKLRSDLDLRLEDANLAQAKLVLLDAQGRRDEALSDLTDAIGLETEPKFLLNDCEASPAMPGSLDILLSRALWSRPDLMALKSGLEATLKRAQASKAARLPIISGIAAGGLTPYEASPNEGLGHEYGMVGVNVSVPLFTGGRLTAEQKKAELEAKALQEDLLTRQNAIVRSVRNAWLQMTTAFHSIGVADEFAAAANAGFELAQSRYSVGSSSLVELDQADLQQIQAAISAINARYDYQIKRAVLAYETGDLK